ETDFTYVKPPIVPEVAHVGAVVRPMRDPPPCCFFAGDIDEVRLFNYALDPEEISDLFGAGPSKCCPAEGDTRCDGLTVTGPEDGGPGSYTVAASATDDSGDAIIYTFTAQRG